MKTSICLPAPGARILVRGVNWLGDAVMTTPALMRLREKFPGAHITLLTPEKLADLWEDHPAIDDIISFTRDEGVLGIANRLRVEPLKRFLESSQERKEAGRAAYEETAMRGGTLAQATGHLQGMRQVPRDGGGASGHFHHGVAARRGGPLQR